MDQTLSQQILETVMEFSRLIAGSDHPKNIFALLIKRSMEPTGASAAAVLAVTNDQLKIAESQGLDEEARALSFESGSSPSALVSGFKGAGGPYSQIHLLPLIEGGDLYGYLLLFFQPSKDVSRQALFLAESLALLAAAILKKDIQYKKLRRAYDELKMSRDLLSRSEKINYLGQVTASIIHDLKNILAPLPLQAELVKRCADNNPKVNEYVEKMKVTVNRGVAVVDRFRIFSKLSESSEGEDSSLNELIEEAVEIAQAKMRSQNKDIEFVLEFTEVPRLWLNPNDFISSMVNLISNAIDASPSNTRVFIRSSKTQGFVQIQVEDQGIGMTKDTQSHLFEPFFTTKGREGTGLGLVSVESFVKKNQGRLRVTSRLGFGTCLTIELPLTLARTQNSRLAEI